MLFELDFLATGTAEQLGIIIDYCEHKFDEIDAMIVVFGSPGLFDVEDVYNVLSVKLDVCEKPIYPVLPSVINAQKEIKHFLAQGHINFPDEVVLGQALTAIHNTNIPEEIELNDNLVGIDIQAIREIIESNKSDYLDQGSISKLLDAADIDQAKTHVITSNKELIQIKDSITFPVAMKVIGPLHKTDVGGVILNVKDSWEMSSHFDHLMKIDGTTGVIVQPMIDGQELFVGVKYKPNLGHIVICGLGGIFIEVLNDFSSCLAPVSPKEADLMIKLLKGYKLITGIRGKEGVNEELFRELILKVSRLVSTAPEIMEMDLNPLMGNQAYIKAVDTRIKIEKSFQ